MSFGGEGLFLSVHQDGVAATENPLRRPFHHQKVLFFVGLLVDGDLILVARVERNLLELGMVPSVDVNVEVGLYELEKGGFRSVAQRLPHDPLFDGPIAHDEFFHVGLGTGEVGSAVAVLSELAVLVPLGVVAERGDADEMGVGERRGIHGRLGIHGALAVVDGGVVNDVRDRHHVLCERSRFVGADTGRGSERFDTLEILDEDVFGGHAIGGQGEGDGDGR